MISKNIHNIANKLDCITYLDYIYKDYNSNVYRIFALNIFVNPLSILKRAFKW